jgi:hypothetical protein
MEESVWIIIGSLLALIAIFLIGGAILSNTIILKQSDVSNTVKQLTEHCNVVCTMTTGTMLGTQVRLPAESVLTVADTRICVYYEDKNTCDFCKCSIQDYTLNLTGSSQFFDVQEFRCAFTREAKLKIECQG